MIRIGGNHNIILTETQELYVCGNNERGQLGLGDYDNRNTFIKLEHDFDKIQNISCGYHCNMILTETNDLYVCGRNENGQLGLGDNIGRNTFVKLEHNFGKIKNIFCSNDHNIILTETNDLYVCGYNEVGQLGLGDNEDRNTFVKLEHNFGKIQNIYCRNFNSIILTETNELYVCGDNSRGQLGLGDKIERNTFVKLEHNFGKIQNISCGFYHNVILTETNELYICGYNNYEQLGLGDKIERNTFVKLEHNFGKIQNISCGALHNMILTETNELYVCGWNIFGQLGLGDNKDRITFVQLEHNFGKIQNIFCGAIHNIILTETNDLYVCGYNFYGQLGLGDRNNHNTFDKLELDFDIFAKKQIYLKLNLTDIIL